MNIILFLGQAVISKVDIHTSDSLLKLLEFSEIVRYFVLTKDEEQRCTGDRDRSKKKERRAVNRQTSTARVTSHVTINHTVGSSDAAIRR